MEIYINTILLKPYTILNKVILNLHVVVVLKVHSQVWDNF